MKFKFVQFILYKQILLNARMKYNGINSINQLKLHTATFCISQFIPKYMSEIKF